MKTYTLRPQEIKLNDSYDVIVAGGGPAGCSAAIAAARKGAKTLIIEATGCLGGMSTMGLVPTWCPFSDKEQVIYKGIAQEIFNASNAGVDHVKPGDVDWVAIDPEHLKLVYDKLVTEAGADILFNT
ncbi:MAG: FAD-dependent oxidoreductase, partial [Eubacteriales bacterium]|nr:FAD-dependent oxidoreductase [Eubacteriales bacterium]